MSLVFVILSVLTLSTAYSTCRNAIIMNINRGISPQATWGLFKQKPRATVKDVVSVLGRFEKREDFYEGRGYARPEKGLLTKEMFYENISKKQFKRWPISPKGIKVGVENSSPEEIKRLEKELSASPPSKVPYHSLSGVKVCGLTVFVFLGWC